MNRSAAPSPWLGAGDQPFVGSADLSRIAAIPLVGLIAVGLLLRVLAAVHQPLFVDEPFSLLAIQATAAQGFPQLPTGALYLHGATLSYLLAPLSWVGLVQPDNLIALRLASAVAGAASVWLTWKLARAVGASSATALFAAALLAFDPASVEWSGYLRMYALAQTLSLAVALLFLAVLARPAIDDADKRRAPALWGLVLVFWLDVFTHLATALLWPAMACMALVVYRRQLLHARRDVAATLGACLGAPVAIILLNGVAGSGAGTKIAGRAEGLPGISFLGDDKIQWRQMLKPDPAVWASLFGPGPLDDLLPFMATFVTGLLVAALVLNPAVLSWSSGAMRRISALLLLNWIPVLLFAVFAGDASTRYGLFLAPFGIVLTALALQTMATVVNAWLGGARTRVPPGSLLAIGLGALMLLHGGAGTTRLIAAAEAGKGDHASALRYVQEWRRADETVITAFPPPMAALVLESAEYLVFLPGGEASPRTLRYVREDARGTPTDYWLGVPALPTGKALCSALAASSGGWLAVATDEWDHWGYNGGSRSRMNRRALEMREVITGSTSLVFQDRQGRAFRLRPAAEWSETTQGYCDRANKRANRHVDAES